MRLRFFGFLQPGLGCNSQKGWEPRALRDLGFLWPPPHTPLKTSRRHMAREKEQKDEKKAKLQRADARRFLFKSALLLYRHRPPL